MTMMTTGTLRLIRGILLLAPLAALGPGCVGVRRELTVVSDPPGALVYVNGDEVGRTPVTREFLYYGTVDLQLRKDGYQTLSARPRVWAPLWQIPPIDLLAEALPLTDRQKLSFTLKPRVGAEELDRAALIGRAAQLGTKLEASEVREKRAAQKAGPAATE